MNNKKYLSGIGGWLLLLVVTYSISLVLEPLFLLGTFSIQEHANPNIVTNSQWQNYKFLLDTIFTFVFVFKLYMLYALINQRKPEVVSLTKKCCGLQVQ